MSVDVGTVSDDEGLLVRDDLSRGAGVLKPDRARQMPPAVGRFPQRLQQYNVSSPRSIFALSSSRDIVFTSLSPPPYLVFLPMVPRDPDLLEVRGIVLPLPFDLLNQSFTDG